MANSKKCFTHEPGMSLTEVIIAMLVIGVICAILIPLFKGLFYDKQEFKTKSLKAYQGVNQVLLMNKTQHGQALSPWKNQGIEWVKDNFAAMNVVKYLDESECSNLFVEAEDDVRMCFLNRDGMVYGFVVDGDEQGNVSSNLYVDVNAKKSPNELTAKKSDPRDQWMMKYDQTKGRYEFVLDKPEAPENGPGCEPGTYVINGKCAKCPSGKTYNAYEKKCEDPSNDPTKCEEQGGVMVDGKCMICKTGTKYDSEKKLCLSTGDCSGGETQTGGVCMCEGEQTDDGCMLCPNGYTYNEDQDKCMPGSNTCEEGFSYNSSTGLCEKPKGNCNFDSRCSYCLENNNCGGRSYTCYTDEYGSWTDYFCINKESIKAYQINDSSGQKVKRGGVEVASIDSGASYEITQYWLQDYCTGVKTENKARDYYKNVIKDPTSHQVRGEDKYFYCTGACMGKLKKQISYSFDGYTVINYQCNNETGNLRKSDETDYYTNNLGDYPAGTVYSQVYNWTSGVHYGHDSACNTIDSPQSYTYSIHYTFSPCGEPTWTDKCTGETSCNYVRYY